MRSMQIACVAVCIPVAGSLRVRLFAPLGFISVSQSARQPCVSCGPLLLRSARSAFRRARAHACRSSVLQYLLRHAAPDAGVKRVWRWALLRLIACARHAVPMRPSRLGVSLGSGMALRSSGFGPSVLRVWQRSVRQLIGLYRMGRIASASARTPVNRVVLDPLCTLVR